MAALRNLRSGSELVVPGRCLIGRAGACDLVLAEKNVSAHHASIEWFDGCWKIQDLGSRNGTFVDEQRMEPNTRIVLPPGAQLRFGRDAPTWVFSDDSAPRAMARDLATGLWRVAEGGYLAVPDPDTPDFCVYQLAHGGWVVERDGEHGPVEDRATIAGAGGSLWRIYLPVSLPGTLQDSDTATIIANLRLRFRVSADEEQVELTGYFGERRLDLQIRAHHYPLLLLARRRLAEIAARAPEPEQGWVSLDDMLRMLRMSEPHFNIAIHRARTHMSRAGVLDAASLVERQVRMKRLRIGVSQLEIAALAG